MEGGWTMCEAAATPGSRSAPREEATAAPGGGSPPRQPLRRVARPPQEWRFGMIEKILIPLDGSPAAEAVLPLVTHLALAEGAAVELVTVLTPVAIWDAAASIINLYAEDAA